MKINRAILTNGVTKQFEESVDFSQIEFDPTHIKCIPSCIVKVNATDYESVLRVEFEIKATVIGVCSYSLEDVELHYDLKDEISISDDPEDVDCYYEKNVLIDLDPYILGILLANVPIRIIKDGAELPKSGDGYTVMSEDEYEEEKKNSVDHRWDKLDEIDISDK